MAVKKGANKYLRRRNSSSHILCNVWQIRAFFSVEMFSFWPHWHRKKIHLWKLLLYNISLCCEGSRGAETNWSRDSSFLMWKILMGIDLFLWGNLRLQPTSGVPLQGWHQHDWASMTAEGLMPSDGLSANSWDPFCAYSLCEAMVKLLS